MGRLNRTDDGARCVLTGTTSNPSMYAGEWLAAIRSGSMSRAAPDSALPSRPSRSG